MEISEVKKRVLATIDAAKRAAAERRTRMDEAARDYGVFLERVAVPLFHQLASALKAEGYLFTVFTPSGSVRLSERSGDDYIELVMDTAGDEPAVMGHTSRRRGSRVMESERPIAAHKPIRDLAEEDVLQFVLKA